MNRIILTPEEKKADGHFVITDLEKLAHLNNVLNAKAGDTFKSCELDRGLGNATIRSIDHTQAELEYNPTKEGLKSNINLLVGLSRPQTCKKILEHGSSMGVESIHFFKSALSEKSYLDSKIFQNNNYRKLLQLGISQSAIYFQEPKITITPYLPLQEIPQRNQKFILSLKSEKTFQEHHPNFQLPITLAIGPERGWVEDEEQALEQMGFVPVSISRSTLRVEQAIFSALAQLEMLRISHTHKKRP